MENPLSMKISQLSNELSTVEQRDAWLMQVITLGELLKPGAPTLNEMALNALLDLYSEFLEEVGPERFVAAYKLVLKSSKFRPDIADLYLAASLPVVFPVVEEAKSELTQLIKLMRHHGKKLRNRGTPEKDLPLPLPALLADVIEDMGCGDIPMGLEAIWRHPTLDHLRQGDDWDEVESFRAVAGEKIERKWVEFYTKRKAERLKLHAA